MKSRFDARTVLAFGITLTAVLGITALSLAIILSTDTADGGLSDKAQNVLNAVLPLFGT